MSNQATSFAPTPATSPTYPAPATPFPWPDPTPADDLMDIMDSLALLLCMED